MNMNVTKGMPFLDSLPAIVEKLWHMQDKQIHMMVHFFTRDGKCEIAMLAVEPEAAAQWVKGYCLEHHPVAVVLISESWSYTAPQDFDLAHAQRDPQWYEEQKKLMPRKELLLCNIETNYGFRDISWEIIRNGTDVHLGQMSQRDFTGIRKGRFGTFLPKVSPLTK